MRIAIITLPLLGNYGGILQNYALQTVLKRMGHTVETIRLPWELRQPYWRQPFSYGKRFMDKYIWNRRNTPIFFEVWYNRTLPILLENMWQFIDKHITTCEKDDFLDIHEGDYDAFVVGSDQIWRPCYSYKEISNAYLSFAKDWKDVKRIAYAASFGTETWEYTALQTKKCIELLRLFDGVSVREESAVSICREYLQCEAEHVLDPTMLLDVNAYIRLFVDKLSERPRGQLLTYILDESYDKSKFIKLISEKYHYKRYQANSRFEDFAAPLEERIQPSVEQWLKDFYDAKFVVTDSFHATVFSILFGKPFVVLGNPKRGLSRIFSLLKMFGLENHMLLSLSCFDYECDYTINSQKIDSLLKSLSEKSINFLKRNLR